MRLVKICTRSPHNNAIAAVGQCPEPSAKAIAVPIRTGATEAGKVLGRIAKNQIWSFENSVIFGKILRPARKLAKIRFALLQEGIAPFLSFLSHIKKHGCVAGQFLKPGLT